MIEVTTIQTDLVWENKNENLKRLETLFKKASSNSSAIILPEMFSTGFSMLPQKLAESMEGSSVKWMKQQSIKVDKVIIGSLIIEENKKYFNRLIVAFPSGEIKTYDKKHLFRYAEEDKNYTAGQKELIIDIKEAKIALFVCYDLRFPVWTRNLNLKYDAAIYIANWPEKRREHWSTLLKARSIENQAYVIGVNRIGTDGNGVSHSGDTAVFNPLGEKISNTVPHQESVENIKLDTQMLKEYRKRFPAHMDADPFDLL